MKRHAHLSFLLFLAGILAILLSACVSGGAPPAPIAEIPSLVSFPDSVEIDLSQAGGTPGSAMKASGLKLQTPSNFSDIISLGPILISVLNDLLDTFLGPLAALEIPVSPSVRTFEGLMTFAPGLTVPVKIDFADFDLDGNGTTEGCTGCTCPTGCEPLVTECPTQVPAANLLPICYRVWILDTGQTEFTRFSAGRIDRYATRNNPDTAIDEENAGNGSFRLGVTTQEAEGARNTLDFGINYFHRDDTDPALRESEFFVQDRTFNSAGEQTAFDNFHSLVTQAASTVVDSLKKTAKLDFRQIPEAEDRPGLTQYIGSFLDDFDFWSGTFNLQNLQGDPMRVSGENICALISTGDPTARENCLDLGIDVGGEAFLRPTEVSDVAFPADFPPTPTF